MRANGAPTWRHVAAALGTGILIGIATTNNFYSLSAARPSTEFHKSPYAPAPLAPYYPPKQPKPYTPVARAVRKEKKEEPQTYGSRGRKGRGAGRERGAGASVDRRAASACYGWTSRKCRS